MGWAMRVVGDGAEVGWSVRMVGVGGFSRPLAALGVLGQSSLVLKYRRTGPRLTQNPERSEGPTSGGSCSESTQRAGGSVQVAGISIQVTGDDRLSLPVTHVYSRATTLPRTSVTVEQTAFRFFEVDHLHTRHPLEHSGAPRVGGGNRCIGIADLL